MRSKVLLQPTTSFDAGTATQFVQDLREARRVGHGKTGVAFCNVYANTFTSGTLTVTIETASCRGVDPKIRSPFAASFWLQAGQTAQSLSGFGTGAVVVNLSNLAEWIRYNVQIPGGPGSLEADIAVYLADT